MLTIPGYHTLTTLHQGAKTSVYRALRQADQAPVVLKALVAESPTIGDLGRYRYSYSITKDLKLGGVCQTFALIESDNRPVLVMEDIGGIALSEVLEQEHHPFQDLGAVLRLMGQIAGALHQFHQHNLVHRDLKPSNVIVVPETGQAQIVDFDLASRLTREAPEAWNPHTFQGTPAYISPEQTGRMNRMIDHRTDLYSLGVMLFELLAGRLPFEEEDTMSLIHSHIAVPPPNLCDLVSTVPPILNAIVQKLLAKTPEARYQSAVGVQYDLQYCLNRYREVGDCPHFALAQTDISPRLQPSQKLYGREREIDDLMDAFNRVSHGGTELLLVAGYSGIGKSSLVREVHKPIARAKGRFASGKYDQLQNVPYAGLLQALQQITEDILTEPEEELNYWRRLILQEFGEIAQVVIDVVPALALLLGPQPPAPQVSMLEAQNRFQRMLIKFVRLFATAEHPLTIFLDDLQWARSNTLHLLKLFLTDPDMKHLLLLGAYRDNEIDETHPLSITLNELLAAEAAVTILQLTPLSRANTHQFIADTLKLDLALATPLADTIYTKTQGNPFFASRLLLNIHDDGLLQFDLKQHKWKWDQTQLQELEVAENVLDLMKQTMSRLPQETQEYLHLASCIGNQFDLNTLARLSETDTTTIARALWPALEEEFLIPLTDAYRYIALLSSHDPIFIPTTESPSIAYRILHDKLQEAAYQMKPLEERQRTHLRLGRLWSETLDEEQREEHLFDYVNHWNQGRNLLESEAEKLQLAQYNLQAGLKAMDAAAYAAAFDFFTVGMQLLPDDPWHTHHTLTFALSHNLADVALMIGNFTNAQTHEENIQQHATKTDEFAEYYRLRLKRCSLLGNHQEVNQVGLEALQTLFGMEIPQTPEEWQAAAGRELAGIAALLEGRDIASLLHTPKLKDLDEMIASEMKMLVSIFPHASVNPAMLMVVVPRLVRLSIDKGHIPESSLGYAFFALIQVMSGDHKAADAFGSLALQLAKQSNDIKRQPQVSMIYGCWIAHWLYPFDTAIEYVHQAVINGLENGIYDWVGWASMNIPWLLMARGAPLDEVLKEARQSYKLARTTLKYDDAAYNAAGCIHAIIELLGDTNAHKQFDRENLPFDLVIDKLSHYQMAIMALHVLQMQAACVMGDWQRALKHSEIAKALIPVASGLIGASECYFYRTLALLASRHQTDDELWAQHLEEIHANKALFDKFAAYNPDNHRCKQLLLQAELCALDGDLFQASDLYDEAIDAAEAQNLYHIEGLALERVAGLYTTRNKTRIARSYLVDARYAYVRWGAQAKVSQLEEEHPSLRLQIRRSTSNASSKGPTISGGHSAFDIQTILKASQTLSEEIVLSILLQKLMITAIENAGAQCGSLILRRHGEWFIEAEIETQGAVPRVLEHTPLDKGKLSASVIRFVERSRESLVLNNAQESPRFGYEPYIVKHNIKSLLCSPIIHQSQLIGMLYLENNLTTNAFTDERCAILDIISAQAAISIENAQLYANLEEKVSERTLELREAFQKLQNTQTQLVQSEKMASLGTLVAGVAHEINNPANFTHSGSQNLVRRMEDLRTFILDLAGADNPDAIALFETKFAPIFSNLNAIVDGTQRIKGIVRDLRTFSRLDESEQKEADLIAGLNSTLSLVRANYHEHVDFSAHFEQPEVNLNSWPAQLNQVFMNIMVNACQAIHTRQQVDPSAPRGKLQITSNIQSDWLHIIFQDNGCGMPQHVKERIFEPFFTTRTVGQGTGLGLSISYSIIEKHRGQIKVESSPDQGTTFTILLPLSM